MRLKNILNRFCRSLIWKLRRIKWIVERSRPGATLHICRDKGLGDVLMCTPALRALKQAYPRCRIYFYTRFPDLVQGLPYIDEVSVETNCPPQAIWMSYEGGIPPATHLAEIIGERIGIRVKDVRPDCAVAKDLVEKFKGEWRDMPRPHIVVQRRAGPWTPNKNWPDQSWEKLLTSLVKNATIIEIGDNADDHPALTLPNYVDLRGKTNLKKLVACIAASDILVAPDSGPMHIAAAVRTSAVVILGGYILAENTAYPGNKILYTPIHCSPCWLRMPCPIDRECLKQISPETVEQAVNELWRERA
jgi:ADP-heptose:LPS heptosyltransferase